MKCLEVFSTALIASKAYEISIFWNWFSVFKKSFAPVTNRAKEQNAPFWGLGKHPTSNILRENYCGRKLPPGKLPRGKIAP